MSRSAAATLRSIRRRTKAREASERADNKALAAGSEGWAPFPGSGVHLATLRRLEQAGRIEIRREIDSVTKGIKVRFRTV